jgi:hypothetical protein
MIFCRESSKVCCVFGNGVRKTVSDSEVLELVEKNLEEYGADCATRLLTWEGFLHWAEGKTLEIEDIKFEDYE